MTDIVQGKERIMTDRTTIGQNIAALRKQAGLTQTELADKLHVSHQAISQWERAETLPDILTLPALAAIFGQSTDILLGIDTTHPVENPSESETLTTAAPEPVSTGKQEQYRLTGLPEDCDYTVVLEKNGVRMQEIPADIRKQIIIVLEGNCQNLSSTFTTEIRGNVEGNAAISGGAHIGEWIGGDASLSGGATIGGDINGDCGISGGASIGGSVYGDLTLSGGASISGSINGDATFSGQANINGSVNGGDVTTDSPLTIGGNVDGDVDCSDLTVGGDINGDVDCRDCHVEGDINGDTDSGSLTVDGDINGDTDCSDCMVGGSVSGDITTSGSVQIGGDLEGDIVTAETVVVNGDANGDISAGSVKVLGNAPDCVPDEDNSDTDIAVDVDVEVDVDIGPAD